MSLLLLFGGDAAATTASAGHAAGTGAAQDAALSVALNAGHAAGTGAAYDAVALAGAAASAGHAAGTGVANTPSVAIAPTAGHAAGTGAAYDATVATTSTTVSAGHAAGTGAAYDATVRTRPAELFRVNWARKRAYEDVAKHISGLVGYWRLGDTTGSLALDEISGNHGTYTGPTLGAASLLVDDDDPSASFDGSNDYVTIPDATELDTADTFSFVALIDRAATGAKHYIAHKGSGAWGLYVNATDYLVLEEVGTADIVTSTRTINAERHLVAVTKSGSTVKLYAAPLAGPILTPECTGTVTNQTLASTSAALEIGRSAVPDSYFSGTIDEALLFNVAIADADVARLFVAARQGELGAAIDDITERVRGWSLRDGRNPTRAGDQVGQLSLALRNEEPPGATNPGQAHFFTAERNLARNPSAESGTDDFETDIDSFVTAGAAKRWVASPAAGCGSYGVEYTTPASANRGGGQLIDGYFADGSSVTLAIRAWAASGTPTLQIGIGSTGTPADVATENCVLSTSEQTFDVTLTTSGGRSDLAAFWRDAAGAGITFVVDGIQINRGATANAYLEGPTWPMLQPGALTHLQHAHGSTYPMFAGYVEYIREGHGHPRTAELRAQDGLRELDEPVDLAIVNSAHYLARYALIDAAIRRAERSVENLCSNGSFEADTADWSTTGARVNTQAIFGSWSLELGAGEIANYDLTGLSLVAGRVYSATYWVRSDAGSKVYSHQWGDYTDDYVLEEGLTATTTPTRHCVAWTCTDTTGANVRLRFVATDASVYVDGVVITEGSIPAETYVDIASPTGRLRNRLAPWYGVEYDDLWDHGWSNFVSNPEAVTNTTGWAVTTNGFITGSGASIARVTVGNYDAGGWGGDDFATAFEVTASGANANSGASFSLSGRTYYAGHTYRFRLGIDAIQTATSWDFGIGSNGTTSDKAQTTEVGALTHDSGGRFVDVTWTPSADRTDARLFVRAQSASAGTLTFTAVLVHGGPTGAYARTGFTSPSALSEVDTITTVADGVSHSSCTSVTTKAVAGSGVILRTQATYAIAGVPNTLILWLKASSGTPSVAVGAGKPYGASPESTTRTVALSASEWRPVPVKLTPATTDRTSDHYLEAFIMTTSAAAITFYVEDQALYVGSRLQRFVPLQCAGIDTAESGKLRSWSFTAGDAVSQMATMNAAILGRNWIDALSVRPWWRVTTTARQSVAGQAVAWTFDAGEIRDLQGIERAGEQIHNEVIVEYDAGALGLTASEAAPVITAFDEDGLIRSRRRRALTAGSTTFIHPDDAQDIADAILARERQARPRRQIVPKSSDYAAMMTIGPDSRVASTSTRALLAEAADSVLSRQIDGAPGGEWRAIYDVEEWIGQ